MNTNRWYREVGTGSFPEDVYTVASDWNAEIAFNLFKILSAIFGFIVFMWLVNITVGPGFNLIFFILNTILLTAVILSPIPVVMAAILGFWHSWLKDTDRSQGILNGIRILIHWGLYGILFAMQLITGFLATWSFAENPFGFFYVLCGGIIILVAFRLFNLGGGKWMGIATVVYSAIVIASALFGTFSSETKTSLTPNFLKAGGKNGWTIDSQYDLRVPARGCSDPIQNTDRRYYTDPTPKEPGAAWPPATMVAYGGTEWEDYRPGARWAKLAYCDAGKTMYIHVVRYLME